LVRGFHLNIFLTVLVLDASYSIKYLHQIEYDPQTTFVINKLNIIWMIFLQLSNTFTMSWVGHVVRMGRGEVCTGFWRENLKEKDHWRDPGVDGRIILRLIFRKYDVGLWTGLS
jgi:hypothetical protein